LNLRWHAELSLIARRIHQAKHERVDVVEIHIIVDVHIANQSQHAAVFERFTYEPSRTAAIAQTTIQGTGG